MTRAIWQITRGSERVGSKCVEDCRLRRCRLQEETCPWSHYTSATARSAADVRIPPCDVLPKSVYCAGVDKAFLVSFLKKRNSRTSPRGHSQSLGPTMCCPRCDCDLTARLRDGERTMSQRQPRSSGTLH